MKSIWFLCVLLIAASFVGCKFEPVPKAEQAIAHYVKAYGLSDDQALAELTQAVHADPTLSVAHTAIGDIYRRQGDHELAKRAYESACQANPYFFRPHYNLGVTYQSLAEAAKTAVSFDEMLRKACEIYLRAIIIDAHDYDTNLNLSACYFQLGKYEQAEQYCQAAINIDPDKPQAYGNLGIIYDSQNRLYDAVKAYKRSLEAQTNQPRLLLNLGSTYLRQGRNDHALWAFREAAKQDPASSAPLEQTGSCYYRINELDKAMEAYQKALAINPKSPEAFRGIGVIHMTQYLKDTSRVELREKALAAWNSSLDLNSNQDDLKKLVEKYSTAASQPAL